MTFSFDEDGDKDYAPMRYLPQVSDPHFVKGCKYLTMAQPLRKKREHEKVLYWLNKAQAEFDKSKLNIAVTEIGPMAIQ
jgi:hypothetical protein